jgi:hypothetical protein
VERVALRGAYDLGIDPAGIELEIKIQHDFTCQGKSAAGMGYPGRRDALVLRLNQKVHRVEASPPPSTASDQGLLGDPMNLLSVSEH